MVCRHWTQKGAVAWLLNTQLCPLIWALVLALLAMLVYKAGCVHALPTCLPLTFHPGQHHILAAVSH